MSYDAKYPYIEESDGAKGVIGGRLRMNVAAGAASGSLLGVTPMKPHDQIRYVIDTTTWTDLVANVTSVGAGGFSLSGASTLGHSLLVGWLDLEAR